MSRKFVSALAVLGVVAACATQAERTPFPDSEADESGAVPLPTPPRADAAAPPEPSGPVVAVGDAAVDVDAADDCARTAPSKKCGLHAQCGCAPGETCDVTDLDGNVECVTAGRAAMGRPCTSTAGCAAGLTCVYGTCHSFCPNPGAACATQGAGPCVQVATSDGPIPNFAVCMVSCDVRDPNACGGTTAAGTGACHAGADGVTDCQAGGERAEHATCSPTDECAPGLVCVGSGTGPTASSTCKRWCRVGSSDCGLGKACLGFATKVRIGGVEHGACP